MLRIDKRNRNHIFQRFLISYLIILSIPIIFCSFIHFKTVKMVEADVEASNIKLLEQSAQTIDNSFMQIEGIIRCLSFNPKINTFIDMPSLNEGSNEIIKVKEAWEILSSYNYVFNNANIIDLLIYSPQNSITISSKITYVREPFFYPRLLNYKDLPSWNDLLTKAGGNGIIPATSIRFFNKDYSAITLVEKVPKSYICKKQGSILALVDNSKITSLLERLNIGGDGWAYMADDKGNVLSSVSSDTNFKKININTGKQKGILKQNIFGKDYIVSYITSEISGYEYVVVLSSKFPYTKVSYIKNLVWSFIIVSFLLGLIMAYLLAYKNAKPIKNALESIKGYLGVETCSGNNTYDVLQSSISGLINENQDLQKTIREYVTFERTTLQRSLLEGYFSDINEINEFLYYADMQMKGNYFVVLILNICTNHHDFCNEKEKFYNELALIKKFFIEYRDMDLYLYDMNESNLAMIMAFDETSEQKCKEIIYQFTEQAYSELNTHYGIKVFFGIGKIYNNILNICDSYLEARKAIENRNEDSFANASWFYDMSMESEGYFYSIELESRLLKLVKIGQKDKMELILQYIFNENFIKRKLSKENAQQLIQIILLSITRLKEELEIAVDVGKFQLKNGYIDNPKEIFQQLQKVFCDICDIVISKNFCNKTLLANEIMNYMEANYMNTELCICTIAENLNKNEDYLYQFFKNEIGSSFSVLLEKIRMDHACELLTQTELLIEDITKNVGYSSSHAFRRAFKRRLGVLPTEYRELKNSKGTKLLIGSN